MLILISPAKKIDHSIPLNANQSYTSIRLEDKVKSLVQTMKMKGKTDLMELMHISENLANLNVDRYKTMELPFSDDNGLAAVEMFKGDVYQGLEAENFNEKERAFAQSHLRILSGLYGLLRPYDIVMPYRLEMGTKLKTKKGTNLYHFWDKSITELVNEDAANQKAIINLASNEYFKSVQKKALQLPLINVHFKEMRNGKLKVISFNAKKARGIMAKFIIENELKTPEELKTFNLEDYSFNADESSDTDYLFTR